MKNTNILSYVIVAKNEHKRKQKLAADIEKLGFQPTFFDAIMGNELSEDFINRHVYDKELLKGEIGCALSHLTSYKEFLKSKEDISFILEDDFECGPAFTEARLETLISWLRTKQAPSILLLQRARENDAPRWGRIEIDEELSIFKVRSTYRTHGYLINRKAAKAILDIQEPLHFVIDSFEFYYHLKSIDIYCLNRDLIKVKDEFLFDSIIDNMEQRTYGNALKVRRKTLFKKVYNDLSLLDKIRFFKRKLEWEYIRLKIKRRKK